MQEDYKKFKKEILDAVKSYIVALDELDQYYNWRNALQLERKRRENAEEKAAKLKKWEEEMAKKKAEKEKKKKRGRRIC